MGCKHPGAGSAVKTVSPLANWGPAREMRLKLISSLNVDFIEETQEEKVLQKESLQKSIMANLMYFFNCKMLNFVEISLRSLDLSYK